MSKKLYWGFATLILLIIGAFVFLIVKNQAEIRQLERETAAVQKQLQLQKQLQQQNAQQVPQGEPPAQGHFHDDGTFHEGDPPEPIQTEQKVQYTAPKGAVLKPNFPKIDPKEDPVKAAYKRLEYIKNNPYAWGGVHSPRATELIAQLLPASLPIDHDDSDEREVLIDELCKQNDPRAAEALIALMCDGGTMGQIMFDTLEEIGPPALPYILPYLEREDTNGLDWIYIDMPVFDSLSRIGVRYRDDLGGIVDHIIIPKFKAIAADEDNELYDNASVIYARQALDRLQ